MRGTGSIGGVSVTWAVGTDVGLERRVNEDSYLASPPAFVVADGMGGHEAGDVASSLVVQQFARLADNTDVAPEQVSSAIDDANDRIFRAGSGNEERAMGTTAVGLVLVANGPGSSWMLFNVGDSRAYRVFDGALELLSIDHSYVQELVDAGHLLPEAARTHPHRNVVTRALGVEGRVYSDVWVRLPVPGERFLLCSDGLTSEVEDADIGRVLVSETDPETAAAELVRLALAGGGRDNVTVIVLDVGAVDGLDATASVTAPRDEPTSEHPLASLVGQGEPTLEHDAVEEVPPSLRVPTVDPVEVVEPSADMISNVPDWDEYAAASTGFVGDEPVEPGTIDPDDSVDGGTDDDVVDVDELPDDVDPIEASATSDTAGSAAEDPGDPPHDVQQLG